VGTKRATLSRRLAHSKVTRRGAPFLSSCMSLLGHSRHFGHGLGSPLYPRYCCKSRFALVVGNSAGGRCDFRVKMWGASSPHVKLTGNLVNASEAIRIGNCFPFRNFAKNQSPCNF
jgi:hypothetical protein